MSEGPLVLLLAAGPGLWMLGGRYGTGFRRVLWPLLAMGCLLWLQVAWWRAGLSGVTLWGVNTLPYGDRTSWPRRLAVFGSYALPAIWLDPRTVFVSLPWTLVTLSLLMLLSRTINWVTWKCWEAQAGLLQAVSLAMGAVAHG